MTVADYSNNNDDASNHEDHPSHDEPKPRLAIIEDNVDLLEELMFFLRAHGYVVWGCESGERFWRQLHLSPVDIVLVDVGLPGEDGFSIVSHIKQLQHHGLVMMTARGSEQDRFKGLSAGADLYLIKPINFSELHQQLCALWHRMRSMPSVDTLSTAWRIDMSAHHLCSPQGQTLKLTSQELALVRLLLTEPGAVYDKGALHQAMFAHTAEPDFHRVDVVLSRLRKKAREHQFHLPIRSVFGQGLAFVHDVE